MDDSCNINDILLKRKAARINCFDDIAKINKIKQDEFFSLVHEDLIAENSSESERPVCLFVFHEKKDGEYTAEALIDELHQNDYYIHDLDYLSEEKDPFPYIKKKSIIRVAKETDKWERKPLFKDSITESVIEFLNLVVAIISLVVSLVLSLWQGDQDRMIMNIFAGIFIASVTLFIVLLCILIKKAKEKSFNALLEKLCELRDDEKTYKEFISFVDNFSANDYEFSQDYFASYNKHVCLLKNLSSLSNSQKDLFLNYLLNIEQKQYWIIFSEYDNPNINNNIDSIRKKCSIRMIFLKRFLIDEKISLINQLIEADPSKTIDDIGRRSVIKNFGIDYIINRCNKNLKGIKKETDIFDKVKRSIESVKEKSSEYTADCYPLLLLMADLYCNGFEKYDENGWNWLFTYNSSGDSDIACLDKNVSTKLFFKTNEQRDLTQLRSLTNEFFDEFQENFQEISICEKLERYRALPEYKQLLIIKILRSKWKNAEEKCLLICEQLYDIITEYKKRNKETWCENFLEEDVGKIWTQIFINALSACQSSGFLMFIPYLLECIIKIYGDDKNSKIFSSEVILNLGKLMVLFNINDEQNELDVFEIHYEIIRKACLQKSERKSQKEALEYPKSFGLLRFNKQKRLVYYNNLITKKENEIIEYFNYLFDFHCATIVSSNCGKLAKMFSSEIRDNDLNKYYRLKPICEITNKNQKIIMNVLQKLSEFLKNSGKGFGSIVSIIERIEYSAKLEDEAKKEQKLSMLGIECDATESATLIFILTVYKNILIKNPVGQEIFLGIGNYVLRMLFLLFYEAEKDFFNDDFKYLVDELITYDEDPPNTILSYLVALSGFLMPNILKKNIIEYLNHFQSGIVKSLYDIINYIKTEDIESFIVSLYVIRGSLIEKEECNKILTSLKKRLEDPSWAMSQNAKIGNQLITLIVNNKVDSSIVALSPQKFFEEAMNNKYYSPNSISILFHEYYRIDENVIVCLPIIAAAVVKSELAMRIQWFIDYLQSTRVDESDENYSNVLTIFLNSINGLCPNNLELINRTRALLLKINDAVSKETQSILNTRIIELNQRYDHVQLINAKAFFRQRVWGHYGILYYLRFLISNKNYQSEEEYENLSSQDKINYLCENAKMIFPILRIDNSRFINKIYFDLLLAWISNDGDIQQKYRSNEKEMLIKFANDAKEVIDFLPINDDQIKKEINKMLDDYIEKYNV